MTTLPLLILLSLIMIVVATAGLWLSFRRGARDVGGWAESIGDPLAVGIFLGAGLMHMLPESAAGLDARPLGYPLAFLIAGVTMLLLGWIERGTHRSRSHEGSATGSVAATGALTVHSLLAGSALGAQPDTATILVLFVALIAHKGAAGFALGKLLANGPLPRTIDLALAGLFVAALPVGVVIGVLIADLSHAATRVVPIILALGAGTFLHFGTVHRHRHAETPTTIVWTLVGFALMAAIALVA